MSIKVYCGEVYNQFMFGPMINSKALSDFVMMNHGGIIKKMRLIHCVIGSDNKKITIREPENSLHPIHQLTAAELIIFFASKHEDTEITITTNSLYILDAIEVYSRKYLVKVRYFLCECGGELQEEVTHNLERIYETFAQPMQILEDKRCAEWIS